MRHSTLVPRPRTSKAVRGVLVCGLIWLIFGLVNYEASAQTATGAQTKAHISPAATSAGALWHGLTFEKLTFEMAEAEGLFIEGLRVVGISETSPAAGKIEVGDVVTYINRMSVREIAPALATLDSVVVGRRAAIVRFRKGGTAKKVVLTRPPPATAWHGAAFETLDFERAEKLGIFVAGVRVAALRAESAASQDLKLGDVIIRAGRQRIFKADELNAILEQVRGGGDATLIRMRQGEGTKQIKIKRPEVPVVASPVMPPSSAVVQPVAAPATSPILALDTGGHTALIRKIFFTPDGKQLISAGADKTVRVWDIATGETIRTMRVQISPGAEGRIFALAISDDMKWLAVAGFMAPAGDSRAEDVGLVHVFDFRSGEMVNSLQGHRDSVPDLEFSMDGHRLVSGDAQGEVILWEAPNKPRTEVADWSQARMRKRFKAHGTAIYDVGLVELDASIVVTGALDGRLKTWDTLTGTLRSELVGHAGRVTDLVVGDANGLIVSGDDTGQIRFWDGARLRSITGGERVSSVRKFFPDSVGVASLALSPDGKRLLIASGSEAGQDLVQIIDAKTREELLRYEAYNNLISSAAWSPDGKLVATAGGDNFEIHIWSPDTGKLHQTLEDDHKLVLQGNGKSVFRVRFSEDGKWIGWGNKPNRALRPGDLEVDYAFRLATDEAGLRDPVLGSSQAVRNLKWVAARPTLNDLQLRRERGGAFDHYAILRLFKGDKEIAMVERGSTTGFSHRTFSILPDGSGFVSAGDSGALKSYDLKGRETGNFRGHDGDIWSVAVSRDGKYMISGSGDQIVKIWRIKDAALVASLFHAPGEDGAVGEWVMWTPEGFYTGSKNAGELVGWQINNGPRRAADYIRGAQIRDTLSRGDVVRASLELGNAKLAAQALVPNHDLGRSLATAPELTIASPVHGSVHTSGEAIVHVFVKAGSAPIDDFRIAVGEISVNTVELKELAIDAPRPLPGYTVHGFRVPLHEGNNEIKVTALSGQVESEQAKVLAIHRGEGKLSRKERLFILAIGVNEYPGLGNTCGDAKREDCDLRFASADAELFAQTMAEYLGRSDRHPKGVFSRVLSNQPGPNGEVRQPPTRRNILDGLAWLSEATDKDTVLLFVAGHGEQGVGPEKSGQYFFLPTDIRRTGGFSQAGRGDNIISWSEIDAALENVNGNRLVFVDSCQAGAVGPGRAYNSRLLETADGKGFSVFLAAGRGERAVEFDSLGQGLFTHVIVEGVRGAARRSASSILRAVDLEFFVKLEVLNRSQQQQTPNIHVARNFVLY